MRAEHIRIYQREWSARWRQNNWERYAANRRASELRCRAQRTARTALRRAQQLSATPPWADLKAIQLYYDLAAALRKVEGPRSYHVDHIIPLRGKLVCGLHTANNLRVIPALENCRKNNFIEGATDAG